MSKNEKVPDGINPFIKQLALETYAIVDPIDEEKTPIGTISKELLFKGRDNINYKIRTYFESPQTLKFFDRDKMLELLTSGCLSGNACKILLFIMSKISRFATSVQLSRDKDLIGKLNIDKNVCKDCIDELISCNIIARKNRGNYWINPMYFFVGKRFDYFSKTNLNSDVGIYHKERKLYNNNSLILGDLILDRRKAYVVKDGELSWVGDFPMLRKMHLKRNPYVELDRALGFENLRYLGVNTNVAVKIEEIKKKVE